MSEGRQWNKHKRMCASKAQKMQDERFVRNNSRFIPRLQLNKKIDKILSLFTEFKKNVYFDFFSKLRLLSRLSYDCKPFADFLKLEKSIFEAYWCNANTKCFYFDFDLSKLWIKKLLFQMGITFTYVQLNTIHLQCN